MRTTSGRMQRPGGRCGSRRSGEMKVFDAPKGRGPYGIHATPQGVVYYASLAGSHIARIDAASGAATVIEPPTRRQGARRVWSDSKGSLWVDRKSTRLNSSHLVISYAVFCLKKKKNKRTHTIRH